MRALSRGPTCNNFPSRVTAKSFTLSAALSMVMASSADTGCLTARVAADSRVRCLTAESEPDENRPRREGGDRVPDLDAAAVRDDGPAERQLHRPGRHEHVPAEEGNALAFLSRQHAVALDQNNFVGRQRLPEPHPD